LTFSGLAQDQPNALFVASQPLPPIYQALDGLPLVSAAGEAVQGGGGMAWGCHEAAVAKSLKTGGHIPFSKLQPVRQAASCRLHLGVLAEVEKNGQLGSGVRVPTDKRNDVILRVCLHTLGRPSRLCPSRDRLCSACR